MNQQFMRIKPLVLEVLTECPDTRNSDSLLYARVLERVATINGTGSYLHMSVPHFLINAKRLGFPNSETVRRTRQKVQAECPWLKADAKTQAERAEREQAYRAFARGEGA